MRQQNLKIRLANFIMVAESASMPFFERQTALYNALSLVLRSKKGYAYFGLSPDAFAKLEATIDRQQAEMDADTSVNSDTMTYAAYCEILGRRKRETEQAERESRRAAYQAARNGDTNFVKELPLSLQGKQRRRRWWQFWK